MLSLTQRFTRPFALLVVLGSVAPAAGREAGSATTASATTSWLYRGSDIPPDRDWVFGELPNGLRYAVRKNGVPPGQISIRMAIDAGSLNERPTEHGYAHFNEHLSFRGSRYVPDGEAKRLWQRLGATFGSDTNASTTPTQTIYKLDLPSATPAGLEESVKVLSGMMAAPDITQAEVEAERRTVLAELREGAGPGRRVGNATSQVFFAGQPLGNHDPIGDVASLNAATQGSLRAFHDRWYRPERAVLVIVGDGDPAVFEGMIRKYFSDWHGVGTSPPDPDFGKPDPAAPRARVIVEPGLPLAASLAVLRPWHQKNDTIEYNRGKLIESLALRLISRRLEQRARAGGSFLTAEVGQDDISRSVDGTFVQIVPLGDNWQAAVRDVRAVIADALVRPPLQADIDREAIDVASGFESEVEQRRNKAGALLADEMVQAVNIRETVASPQVARDVFTVMKTRLTPAALLAATRRMFSGAPIRAILISPKPIPDGEAQLTAAVLSNVRPGIAQTATKALSFDALPKLGPAATVTNRQKIGNRSLEFVTLSNDVRLILLPVAEEGRVFVSVRFGRGQQALPTDRPTVAWVGEGALMASGIGNLDQNALDRLTTGRRISLGFGIADDAFQFAAQTRASDLHDQLRLIATKLAYPRWDAAPVLRVRALLAAEYPSIGTSPTSVVSHELPGLLHGGDPRWISPTLAQIEALTPAAFRALWEPLLKTGPVEVAIAGDFDVENAIAAVADTFGALPARLPAAIDPASARTRAVVPNATPLIRTHDGPGDQATAVLAWPTAGGEAEVYESRKLEILAEIFSGRLFDELREVQGASYSQNVGSDWPTQLPNGGNFIVTAQLSPAGVDRFFTLARRIANDLATKPVTADEMLRSVGPRDKAIARASSGSSFWLSQLAGASVDPDRLRALSTLFTDYDRITPAELQASAKRWLVPEKSFAMEVVPAKR